MQKIRKKRYFYWKILLIILLALSCVGCKQDTANIMDEQAEVDVEVNEEAQTAYQEFLAGERKLYIKDSHVDNPSAEEKYCIGQEGCYIQDILKYCMDMKGMWKEQYPDDPDMQDNRIKRIEYAYMDYVKEGYEVQVEKLIISYPETPYALTSEVRDFFYGESAEDEDKFCTFEYGEDARDFGFPEWHVPCGEFCAMQEWKYEITASSELASEDGRYVAANLNGYPNKETVWAEGVPGNGIGESISITVCCAYNDILSGEGMTSYWTDSYGNVRDGYIRFTEICIVNGYAKTQQIWEENGRVKRLCMYVEGQPYAYLELEDTIKPQYFKLPLDEIKVFDGNDIHFQFVIEDVYPGSKYDDTCMSGLILEYAGRRGH